MTQTTKTTTLYTCDKCGKTTEAIVVNGNSTVGSWTQITQDKAAYDLCDTCAAQFKSFIAGGTKTL